MKQIKQPFFHCYRAISESKSPSWHRRLFPNEILWLTSKEALYPKCSQAKETKRPLDILKQFYVSAVCKDLHWDWRTCCWDRFQASLEIFEIFETRIDLRSKKHLQLRSSWDVFESLLQLVVPEHGMYIFMFCTHVHTYSSIQSKHASIIIYSY